MSTQQRPLLRGAVGFAAGLSISVGAGLGIGAAMDARERHDVGVYTNNLQEATASVEEADRNMLRLERTLGEACMTVIKVYLPGGELAPVPQYDGRLQYTPENDVVDDLIATPGQTCGELPQKARVAYRSGVTASNDAAKANATRDHYAKKVALQQRKAADSKTRDGMIIGSLPGVLFGSLIGGLNIYDAKLHNKRLNRRYF